MTAQPQIPAEDVTEVTVPAAAEGRRSPVPLAVVVLGVAGYLTHGLLTMEVSTSAAAPGPRLFPTLVAVLAYAVGLALLVEGLRFRRRGAGKAVPPPAEGIPDGDGTMRISWAGVAIVSASLGVFMVMLTTLGWLVSAALLFAGVAWGLGSNRHLVNLGVGLVLSSVIQLAFSGGLGLPLPAGILAGL
ncbi:tripartite tricarboxylate transporter TctB family protein [Georgenia sp. TF02-10]|uniref:tripartite tricarboxylate transporter TctB family protein n=1 Tax=Georgenia sp. TF02-10 TaxID=2917725 RepID=UPI001FA73C07|nr:tripartite tricarboxylate transporter TctB family protein [Georgenia sp. TF02-10]UNX55154.1 tripartite tricarboxylate transporter TctB family protein [Georgenia sp. TF02-10]